MTVATGILATIRWQVTQQPIVTLTTDFGLSDAYVAVMKGVILGIAPSVTIVDISHQVHRHSISEAAHLLRSAYQYFPDDAIHIAVVDPGVGTERKAVAARAAHGVYVGPDNGIFAPVLLAQGALDGDTGETIEAEAVELTDSQFWGKSVSHTFHGRDIFAPVAAHLALGVPLDRLGPGLLRLEMGQSDRPVVRRGTIFGSIVHVDAFGNLISNVSSDMLPASPRVEVGGRVINGLAKSYQANRVVALVGSAGLLEIAARNGSAAETLGLGTGDPIVVRASI